MKFVSFAADQEAPPRIGVLLSDDSIVDISTATRARASAAGADAAGDAAAVPRDMVQLFAMGQSGLDLGRAALEFAADRLEAGEVPPASGGEVLVHDVESVRLLAPVPRPPRIRDYLTYESHASGAGLEVPPAFRQMPICYAGNPYSVAGPDDELLWPAYTEQLDFELELGFYIGRGGRNIPVAEAGTHIAGATIFNDVSARDIQLFEMSMQIGPSKGKDFSNVMGPCVVTMDELDEFALRMVARVNGEVWAEGSSAERRFSFADVVAWASYCEDLQPGEFIGVGTVGGGCGFELDRWIQPGDVVELEIEGIGVLRNPVGHPEVAPGAGLSTYSIPGRASVH